MSESEFLNVHDAAVWLGRTEKSLRASIARGRVPYRREGSRIYLSKTELSDWRKTLEGISVLEAVENMQRANGDNV